MPIFQFRCQSCSSVFEYLLNGLLATEDVNCVSCGKVEFVRLDETCFYPNKIFCPHDKDLDTDILKDSLSNIMSDESLSCAGCGTDGAPGKCKSGSGGCGTKNCSCSGSCATKKLNTFVSSTLIKK